MSNGRRQGALDFFSKLVKISLSRLIPHSELSKLTVRSSRGHALIFGGIHKDERVLL